MEILYLHNVVIKEHTANITQVLSMCNAFSFLGHKVTLALPVSHALDNEAFYKTLKKTYHIDDGVELIPIKNPIKNRKLSKFTNHLFLKKILLKKYDLCYTRDVNFLGACLNKNLKTIYESHNFRIHHGSKWLDSFLKRKLHRCTKKPNFIRLISISQNLSNYWSDYGIDKQKLSTLHDGFSANKYKKEYTISEARAMLNISQDLFIAAYTGNLYPNRGVGILIELAKYFPQVNFYIIGGPKKFIPELKSKSSSLKNIYFIGPVPFEEIHLYQFAANVNLGIWSEKVPTINYCSPLKIFEYMAVNRPVVAMGFKTIKEVLRDGENAYISEPGDIEDLKAKLKNAIDDGNEAITCRTEALQKYSWEKRAEKVLSYV